MDELYWKNAFEQIAPFIFKISTPRGWGTGFLFAETANKSVCGIATAAHVIDKAHIWEEPIRISHYESGTSIFLKEPNRAILMDSDADVAAILFNKSDLKLPIELLPLTPEGTYLNVGIQIGWVGFPVISPNNLCFFNGHTSYYNQKEDAYLVDGVAINGVSGGPAFYLEQDGPPRIIGAVSEYISNIVGSRTLPGLCNIRGVRQFQEMITAFKSLDDAKDEETPPEILSTGESTENVSSA